MIVNNAIFTAAAATAAVDCHECSSKMLFPKQCSLENESRLFVDFVNAHHCVRECGVDKMHFVIQQCFFFIFQIPYNTCLKQRRPIQVVHIGQWTSIHSGIEFKPFCASP